MIGITAPTRAVADGTNSASTKPTTMAPMINRAGETPIRLMTSNARRRSSPVAFRAAARNSAPATRMTAEEEKPTSISLSAAAVVRGVLAVTLSGLP